MKTAILAVTMLALCSPAYAQFGGVLDRAKQVKDTKDKIDELNISDEEERKIGEDVSVKVRARFGVVQDPAVTKYVSLVGTDLARQSERPTLQWTFIVLDTDGVNAFASPGGFVHITRGALGLISNEAELAGVLAHEIGHVAHKHTMNAIKKNKAVQIGTNATLADRGPFLANMANKAYEMVLENTFDRGDELDADKASVTLHEEGRLRERHAGRIPDAPRRSQQGSAGAQRPVCVASGNQRAHRTRSARWPARAAPPSPRATRRTSSTRRRRSPRLRWWRTARPA